MNAGQEFFQRQAAADPIFRYANMPDEMPSLKGFQYVAWLFAIASIILRRYYTIIIGIALAIGIVRRAGMIKFSTDWVQKAIFQDDF